MSNKIVVNNKVYRSVGEEIAGRCEGCAGHSNGSKNSMCDELQAADNTGSCGQRDIIYKFVENVTDNFKPKFQRSRKDDKVYSVIYGWGKVVSNAKTGLYPIEVDFGSFHILYTNYGFEEEKHVFPTLFFKEQNIEYDEELQRKINWSKVPEDTEVVIDGDVRYFCTYVPNGAYPYVCYNDGNKKDDANRLKAWPHCELNVKPEEEWYE